MIMKLYPQNLPLWEGMQLRLLYRRVDKGTPVIMKLYLQKPASVGRDATEATWDNDTVVSRCGSKTCRLVEGDSFCSSKKYAREAVMTCATQNVISCKKCVIQYVRESSQALKSRMNNDSNHPISDSFS